MIFISYVNILVLNVIYLTPLLCQVRVLQLWFVDEMDLANSMLAYEFTSGNDDGDGANFFWRIFRHG